MQARDWREALRVAWQVQEGCLAASIVEPAVAEAAEQSIRDAVEDLDRVHKYLERLKEVCAH